MFVGDAGEQFVDDPGDPSIVDGERLRHVDDNAALAQLFEHARRIGVASGLDRAPIAPVARLALAPLGENLKPPVNQRQENSRVMIDRFMRTRSPSRS